MYVVEMSLVMSLSGASGAKGELSYEHTLTLQSPPTSFDVDSCLELLFTAQSHFYVKLVCVTINRTYNERVLYHSRRRFLFYTHKLRLLLPATVSEYSKCSLAFQAKTTTTGTAAVISNIAVFPGQCPPAR